MRLRCWLLVPLTLLLACYTLLHDAVEHAPRRRRLRLWHSSRESAALPVGAVATSSDSAALPVGAVAASSDSAALHGGAVAASFDSAALPVVAVAASSGNAALDLSLDALNNPIAIGVSPDSATTSPSSIALDEETLSCVAYSGPCFFMNHPKGFTAPTTNVAAAKMADSLDAQPVLHPLALPLLPFSLHQLSLLPGTRFSSAQQTNLRWLRMLEPDRLLWYFRNLSGLAQPRGVVPHGGWDGAGTGLRGHIAGHYLSAASMAAAAVGGDPQLMRNLEQVIAGLEECQKALGDGYISGFPQSEFAQMENFPAPPYAWVPYYVMHKLLAGLLDYHRLWEMGSARGRRALSVAVGLAQHLRGRVLTVLGRGMHTWRTFINQEVGGMSEALTDLAVITGNATWVQLAALFERPCFIRPLALQYQRRQRHNGGGSHLPHACGHRAERNRRGARCWPCGLCTGDRGIINTADRCSAPHPLKHARSPTASRGPSDSWSSSRGKQPGNSQETARKQPGSSQRQSDCRGERDSRRWSIS